MEISVQELKNRMEEGNSPIVIDVREEFEYEEFNIGVKNIPLGDLAFRLEEMGAGKEDEIVMLCRSGNRSGQAQKLLNSMGYSHVLNLVGGMLAWQETFG
jgi:rhodanese-related sulfurtransferase